MNTIFMNSEISKTSDPHRLLLHLSDKINLLNKLDKYVALPSIMQYTWKNIKNHLRTVNLKYQL